MQIFHSLIPIFHNALRDPSSEQGKTRVAIREFCCRPWVFPIWIGRGRSEIGKTSITLGRVCSDMGWIRIVLGPGVMEMGTGSSARSDFRRAIGKDRRAGSLNRILSRCVLAMVL